MSFNQYSQTLEELLIMEQFRNDYSGFPEGRLIKSESPDFILDEMSETSIGIELTKLHGPTVNKLKTHYPLHVNGYWAPEYTRENIEYTINAKNEKLHIYQQKKLNRLWLLITVDLDEKMTCAEQFDRLAEWCFFSGFHKIFLFEMKSNSVFELNVCS